MKPHGLKTVRCTTHHNACDCREAYVAKLEAQLAEVRRLLDDQARLLFWGEAMMRSMSGWPATHPKEFTEWKEDWRVTRERYKAIAVDKYAANTKLIAAAPDLLESLELLTETLDRDGWEGAALVIAKAAIAKARSE
jgi:hypothetical protein